MKFDKKEFILIALILLMFIVSLYLYPIMPESMPIHWNAKGEIDGYGSRFVGLFLMPVFLAGIYILFLFAPEMAIYNKNFEKFKNYFYGFKVFLILFFITIYIASLLPNFSIEVNMGYIMVPALAVLFFYTGYILKFAKRNYFIGIRTPWTLTNEKVWDKTHKLGSKLFMASSVLMLFSLFFPESSIWVVIILIIAVVLFSFVYSYLEYKRVVRK